MTVTPIRCAADNTTEFVGASRPSEATQPLPAVRRSTFASLSLHVNADTEIEAHRIKGGQIAISFTDPVTNYTGATLFVDEADLLRLWMHAETARRSELDGDVS